MNILFFSYAARGHVAPTVALVKALIKRGVHVTYCGGEAYRHLIEPTGARFLVYPDAPGLAQSLAFASVGNINGMGNALYEASLDLRPFVDELINAATPDLIVNDSMARWGQEGAQRHGLPYLASYTLFRYEGADFLLNPTFWGQMNWGHGLRYWGHFFRGHFGPLRSIYQGNQFDGERNLHYTSPDFHPPMGRRNRERAVFLGPSVDEAAAEADLSHLDAERDLVYISLGTVNNRAPAFYRACLEAVGDLDVQVLMAIGDDATRETLPTPPKNVIIQAHVPQLAVLKRAQAFVTHGGMNSVHEALFYGVPMVVVPQQAEQLMVGRRVKAVGAGPLLQRQPDAMTLRFAIAQVMTEASYRLAAQRIAQTFRDLGGAERAAEVIVSHRDSQASRPHNMNR